MKRALRGLTAVAASIAAIYVSCGMVGFSPARADIPTSYTMTASANTASLEIDAANAPLLAPQLLYVSAGTAQSQLDSFGDSNAFAGAPFLGQTVDGVGGLVNGLGFGVLPPVPQDLPGYVTSSNPSNPSANDSQGPYSLQASSTAEMSSAAAGIAADSSPELLSSSATAVTSVGESGELTSTAQSTTQPFALGGIVKLGTVQASATMGVNASGNVTQSSSFDLGTITVAGVKVGITQSGLQLSGVTLPLVNLGSLNALLASAGISIHLLPESKTPTSITSAGLEISLSKDIPVEGASGFTIILGQATSQLVEQSSSPSSGDSSAGVTGDSDGGPITSVPPLAADTSSSNQVAPASSALSSPSVTTTSAPEALNPRPVVLSAHIGPDGLKFYLLFILVGLALTATSRLGGALAVRRSTRGQRL